MRLLSHITGSGSLSGAVAFSAQGGMALRAKTQRVQPGSPAQRAAQNIFGAQPGAWRSLTAGERNAWNALALDLAPSDRAVGSVRPSGYNLFTRCQLNLAAIGAPQLASPPAAVPAIPPIDLFTAAPIYSQPNSPKILTGWELILGYSVTPGFWTVIRATAARSAGRYSTSSTFLRQVAAFEVWPTFDLLINEQWQAVFGSLPAAGRVDFTAHIVDPATGFSGPAVSCFATWQADLPSPAVAGTVTIEMEGTPQAQIPNVFIEMEGDPSVGG